MTESDAQTKLIQLLKRDSKRMNILHAVSTCNLPDAFVAAGFLRNLAWDYCHDFNSTPLNDVDVIYFDGFPAPSADESRHLRAEGSLDLPAEGSADVASQKQSEKEIKVQLSLALPLLNWDVKNQARMHIRNHHKPYTNASEAMSWWPEQETAVGVKLHNGELHFVAPFGLARLFNNSITHNRKREVQLFEQRIKKKNWLQHWPKLQSFSTIAVK